jgi:electron transfer flavoprotein alpha subunit
VTVLCLVELDGDAVAPPSLRAVEVAAAMGSGEVSAVLFGAGAGESGSLAGALADSGAAALIVVPQLTAYAPAAVARSLLELAETDDAVRAVVAAATDRGAEVLAHLGALADWPVAANCVSAEADGPARWRLVRQRWAGSVLEDAVLEAPCAVLSVAADAVQVPSESPVPPVSAGELPVREFAPVLADADLVVQAVESAAGTSGVSLATARVVVGGGRGVGGPDGFAPLEELADLLGGVVGVSRVVTSQGWRPHRQQVGQTGTKIAPELYLACGISGAIQHMAGCQGARHIVVINTDKDAPIVSRAEYAVIGDLNEIVPALVAALRGAGSAGSAGSQGLRGRESGAEGPGVRG